MKKTLQLTILTILVACCMAAWLVPTAVASIHADSTDPYYVCLASEDYQKRPSHEMTYNEETGEYLLENISLSSANGFHVEGPNGSKYYDKNGKDFNVEEAGVYRYIIKFNPTKIYDTEEDGYAETHCHITYKFDAPENVSIAVIHADTNTETLSLTYNNYHQSYDLYYLSSVKLQAGDTITEGNGKKHEIKSDGYYRILYTPDETIGTVTSRFNEDGEYGSGEDYGYNIYIEDAPQYYVAFNASETVKSDETAVAIGDKTAYLLTRYEDNVAQAEYRWTEIFAPQPKYDFTYQIYILNDDGYELVDDDNDHNTDPSNIVVKNMGWNTVSFVNNGNGDYTTSLVEKTYHDFDGWYLIGDVNNWGYSTKDIGNPYRNADDKFELLPTTDDDYNEDYDQYRLTVTVMEKQLQQEKFEFYIWDGGKIKYMNLDQYIAIDKAGTYEITFSDEHVYGRGRNYYYTLLVKNRDMQEVLIGSTAEFIQFAENCNASDDDAKLVEAYITKDLDFAQTKFVPIKSFGGILHGGYHTLKNITIDGNQNGYNVFGTLTTDALVERLAIDNLQIAGKDQDYVGFVGRNAGTINGITINGNIKGQRYVGGIVAYNTRTLETTGSTQDVYINGKVTNCVSTVAVEGAVNVGGICGYNGGEIRNVKNEGSVLGKSNQNNTAPINLGGIVGYSSGRLTACENLGTVKADGADYSSMNVGGIVGLCSGEIYYAFNRATIIGSKYVGGIVGYYGTVTENTDDLKDYMNNVQYQAFVAYFNTANGDGAYEQVNGDKHAIVYAVNNGSVTAHAYAAGIVAFTAATNANTGTEEYELPINNCVSDGNITVTAGNYAGGIVGYGLNSVVTGSLSAGTIAAKGTGAGKYVGGIMGYGKSVQSSMSSATVSGNENVGGITGHITEKLQHCYTNVLIIANTQNNIGNIAGSATSYDQDRGIFTDQKVAFNYYIDNVNHVGGIKGRDFGLVTDYAAAKIASEDLANEGMVSSKLAKGFLTEYWIGGEDTATYPVLNYLENLQTTELYGDDDEFAAIFTDCPELKTYAEKYTRITYLVNFLEWNKDNGDLYDDDGILQEKNFDLIGDPVRVYQGDKLTSIPAFKYAKTKDGFTVYEGNKARYFVSFNVPDQITGNLSVYANYTEIATTLADADGKILVEGLFDADTKVTLQEGPLGYYLVFRLNDEEIQVETCTVKFLVGNGAKNYQVILSATNEKIPSEVSGKYLQFNLMANQAFTVQKVHKTTLPNWAWLVIGVAGGAAFVVLAIVITQKVKKAKSK